MRVVVLLTCHNRCEKTIKCINGLSLNKSKVSFVVVDDGSTDGTVEALERLNLESANAQDDYAPTKGCDITVIRGDGNLFYSGGMRKAMEYCKRTIAESDYYVMVNDDVEFRPGILDELENLPTDRAYVGAMQDKSGKCSYGGIKYVKGIHFRTVTPEEPDRSCDTFNANFVAIPANIFNKIEVIDSHYLHSLGDFDYGLAIKRAGFEIEVLSNYAGVCENNSSDKTWRDTSLSKIERIRKKESVKGAPFKPWFYFLRKNFGLEYAIVYSLTPYLRIIIGK